MTALRTIVPLLLAAAALAFAANADARSESAVFALTVEGHGGGAWLNPVGEGCLGDGQQSALRGSMRETLRLSSARPALVTVSGLNGSAGPMRVMPLDRRVPAVSVQAELTREGQVDYLACRPGTTWDACPEIAARTRPECHAPRPVAGLDGCFGSRAFTTTAGLRLVGGTAALVVSPPSGLESRIFACEPEDPGFRPSALIPGASTLTTRVPLPRTRLQRARRGTEIVLRGPHAPNPEVAGCKAPAPATCEPYAGELTFRLRFVCRARRTDGRCARTRR